ncbi:retrovirus-related pol polyprotein from transposon TNT 1-94 [Tanacetum coccineum]|uniref:Retrovirus-related pol polyprotein from transposon TNT 1-94 n=1 Tax=Tanacetum coccineum TaxID=301880 RepID=A0ABQ5A9C1_9ASTR
MQGEPIVHNSMAGDIEAYLAAVEKLADREFSFGFHMETIIWNMHQLPILEEALNVYASEFERFLSFRIRGWHTVPLTFFPFSFCEYDKYYQTPRVWLTGYDEAVRALCVKPGTRLAPLASLGKKLLAKEKEGHNGGSGELIEGRFGGNGGRGGSMSRVGEGKVDSMGEMGGGSLSIRSIVSNDSRGGRGLVVEGGSSPREGGEVNGRDVDLGVSKRLPLEVAGEMISESGRIEVGEVGGGADT